MNSKQNQKDTFIKSATILIVADIVVKILGVLFKIPLANLIGEVGMGYFQTAYDLYLPFYSVAVSGLPVLLSRLVSRAVTDKNNNELKESISYCRLLFAAFGIIMTALVLCLGLAFCDDRAKWGVFVIAPCVLFSSLLGVGRGYFEGISDMVPTAVSQVLEALGKAVVGVAAAAALKFFGLSVEVQAAGATAGVLMGTVAGFIYLTARLKRLDGHPFGKKNGAEKETDKAKNKGKNGLVQSENGVFSNAADSSPLKPSLFDSRMKMIAAMALPIILGSLVTQISGLVDVLTVQNRLEAMITADGSGIFSVYPGLSNGLGGYDTANVPAYLYGCFRGFATPIFALVPNVTAVIGVGLVPTLTRCFESGDKSGADENLHSAMKITSLVVFPAAAGMLALSPQILGLIYSSKPFGAEIASHQLRILSVCSVFAGFSVPFTNILQSVGKERIPVYNMLIGVALKAVINLLTVQNTALNVNGAAIGTLVCYVFIFVSDYYFIVKETGFRIAILKDVLKPFASAALSATGGYFCFVILSEHLSQKLSAVAAILAAVLIYGAAVIITKTVLLSDILKKTVNRNLNRRKK